MYKSAEEAKIALLETIVKHSYKGIEFVTVERKINKNAKFSSYNFRALSNEIFNPFWKEENDFSWTRMIEQISSDRC